MTEMRESPLDQSWLEVDSCGRVLHVAEVPHSCRQPDIFTFGPVNSSGVPSITCNFPTGSVWQCDCGLVWTVYREPDRSYGTLYRFGGPKWRRESRRERRKRLGIRWWQRAPREAR